jgi:hypothetical protein
MSAGRFILVARRVNRVAPIVQYLGRKGFTVYDHSKAAILPSLAEAKAELEYHSRQSPDYSWGIEKLPAGPRAFMRAVAVEV